MLNKILGYSEIQKNYLLIGLIQNNERIFKKDFDNNYDSKLFLEMETILKDYLNNLYLDIDKKYQYEKYNEIMKSNLLFKNYNLFTIINNHFKNDLEYLQYFSQSKTLSKEEHIHLNELIKYNPPMLKIDVIENTKILNFNLDLLNVCLNCNHIDKDNIKETYFKSMVNTLHYILENIEGEEQKELISVFKNTLKNSNELKFIFNLEYLINFKLITGKLENTLKYLTNNIYDSYDVFNYIKSLKNIDTIQQFSYLFNNFDYLVEKKTRFVLDGLQPIFYPEEHYSKIKNILDQIIYMKDPILKQKYTEKIYNEVGNLTESKINIKKFNIRDHSLKLEINLKNLTKEEFLNINKEEVLESFLDRNIRAIFN